MIKTLDAMALQPARMGNAQAVGRLASNSVRPPRFGIWGKKGAKKTKAPDDAMARGIAGIMLAVIGTGALLLTGGAKFIHNRLPIGRSQRQVQASVNAFQEKKDRPSHGTAEFKDMLEVVQQELGKYNQTPDMKQIATEIPVLTEAEQKTVAGLMDQAGSIKDASALQPLFSQWLDILEKHADGNLDRQKIEAQAARYFSRLHRHETIQTALLVAMLASAACLGGSAYLMLKR